MTPGEPSQIENYDLWLAMSPRFHEFGQLDLTAQDIADLHNSNILNLGQGIIVSAEDIEEILTSPLNPCGIKYRAGKVVAKQERRQSLMNEARKGSVFALKLAFEIFGEMKEEVTNHQTNVLVVPQEVLTMGMLEEDTIEAECLPPVEA